MKTSTTRRRLPWVALLLVAAFRSDAQQEPREARLTALAPQEATRRSVVLAFEADTSDRLHLLAARWTPSERWDAVSHSVFDGTRWSPVQAVGVKLPATSWGNFAAGEDWCLGWLECPSAAERAMVRSRCWREGRWTEAAAELAGAQGFELVVADERGMLTHLRASRSGEAEAHPIGRGFAPGDTRGAPRCCHTV